MHLLFRIAHWVYAEDNIKGKHFSKTNDSNLQFNHMHAFSNSKSNIRCY